MATGRTPVRIMIVSEHPIFREGLRRLIETRPAFVIVPESGGTEAAAVSVREAAPDILLLGLTARNAAALDVLRDLAGSGLSIRVIILTDAVGSPEVRRAIQLGARGVVPKDSPPDLLFKSLETVLEGRLWIGSAEVSEADQALRQLEAARRRAKAFGLTQRELEVVRAVVEGRSNREIAEQSSISENTVKSHLTHIFNKLGASNRVELAVFAAHHRLLDGL